MQQYTLIDAAIINGVTMLLLGIFVRVWTNNINKNITKLFDLHEKCTKEKSCTERRVSIARKVHSEGDDCRSKASIELLKHYHDDKGKVMGV